MMDVHGIKPTDERGEYFGRNNYTWFVLANYVADIAPTIARKCRCWLTNDGDGLSAKEAATLADILEEEVRSGRTSLTAYARAAVSDGDPIFMERDVVAFIAFLRASGGFEIW